MREEISDVRSEDGRDEADYEGHRAGRTDRSGLGMGPGANIGDNAALFEATHGTAPKHAGLDKVNPGSLILSGVMMLEYMGWQEAADRITTGIAAAIAEREVTYDLARLMTPRVEKPLPRSEFAEAIIRRFD